MKNAFEAQGIYNLENSEKPQRCAYSIRGVGVEWFHLAGMRQYPENVGEQPF